MGKHEVTKVKSDTAYQITKDETGVCTVSFTSEDTGDKYWVIFCGPHSKERAIEYAKLMDGDIL